MGLTENVRVRRAGFCYRLPFRDFLHRYKLLSSFTWPTYTVADADAIRQLLTDSSSITTPDGRPLQEREHFQLGRTKVFIRHPITLFGLEGLSEEKKEEKSALYVQTKKKRRMLY